MSWQLAVVALLVAAAALYLARSAWRTWKGAKGGCGGGCGCGTAAPPARENGRPTLIPSEHLTLRRRDGNRL
jgi:hypothetical protein